MIDIDKQYLYIDIEAITNYIFAEDKQHIVTEEEQIINSKDALVQKTLFSKNNNEKYSNIKYDIVKSMLDVIYNSGVITEEGNIKYVKEIEDTSIGTKLILNTMLVNEFIKNKLD
jgi:hypothetical protein